MRITEVSVTKLFGIFDHTIPLNLDDRITIIHSDNGFGKTTMLKMLYGLFNERYSELINIPFKEFRVSFDDNSALRVEQEEKRHFPKVTINLHKANMPEPPSFSLDFLSDDPRRLRVPLSVIEEEMPDLERMGSRQWIHTTTGEILSLAAVLERSYKVLERFYPRPYSLPEWLIKLKESINIHLIQTQRLRSFSENERESIGYSRSRKGTSVAPTVSKYAEELGKVIRQKFLDLASLSQSLDSTYPTRLVKLIADHPELADGILQSILSKLNEKRSRLEEIGIWDKEDKRVDVVPLLPKEMTGDTKVVLALHVQDVEEKLSVFDEIADKIGLFKEMIDKRFLYKSIVISKDTGFTFITQDGEALPLTALSSGEQHELVLLYQLLFKTKPDSLVLIDEPEISLHIVWQQDFLRDLQEITQLALFDVLIATHSPQIIHDRWDLTVRLEEPAIV